MPKLSVDLVAPNGVAYTQPTGLFINNEFVEAAKGETIDSIDPASVEIPKIPYWGIGLATVNSVVNHKAERRRLSRPCKPQVRMTSTRPSERRGRR